MPRRTHARGIIKNIHVCFRDGNKKKGDNIIRETTGNQSAQLLRDKNFFIVASIFFIISIICTYWSSLLL